MKIELKCKCGASATFTDNRGVYINAGGNQDKHGRKFNIEVRADEWLDRHDICLGLVSNIDSSKPPKQGNK